MREVSVFVCSFLGFVFIVGSIRDHKEDKIEEQWERIKKPERVIDEKS